MNDCTCKAKDMPFGRCCKAPPTAPGAIATDMSYIADALDIAQSLLEKSQHHPRILQAYNKARAVASALKPEER